MKWRINSLIILFLIFFAPDTLISRNIPEQPFIFFHSLKEVEIRLEPDNNGKLVAKMDKDIYVKSFGWKDDWLLIDISYNNYLAEDLEDIVVHITDWVKKDDFKEILEDEKLGDYTDKHTPSFNNTICFLTKNRLSELKKRWEREQKYYFLSEKENILIHALPNIATNNAVLSVKMPFVIVNKCKDWKGQDWLEIVYSPDGPNLERGWIKGIEIINEKELIALIKLEEQEKFIAEDKKRKEQLIAEDGKKKGKELRNKVEELLKKIEEEKNDRKPVTGKKDFDKRIKEVKIQKLTYDLEENLKELDLLDDIH